MPEESSSAVVRGLEWLTRVRPRAGLQALGWLGGWLGSRIGADCWPGADELDALLGPQEGDTRSRLQRRIASAELRNRTVERLAARHGMKPLLGLIDVRGAAAFDRLRDEAQPLIVLWWHLGAVRAVEAALPRLGHPFFVATSDAREPDVGYRWQVVVDDVRDGMSFMLEALKESKRGVVPVLSLDAAAGREPQLPFLGGSLPIPPGAGWFAARTGARLVPATSRWIGSSARIEVTLHDPIPTPVRGGRSRDALEREIVASAVRWFEAHLRRHPEDLGMVQIRRALESSDGGIGFDSE